MATREPQTRKTSWLVCLFALSRHATILSAPPATHLHFSKSFVHAVMHCILEVCERLKLSSVLRALSPRLNCLEGAATKGRPPAASQIWHERHAIWLNTWPALPKSLFRDHAARATLYSFGTSLQDLHVANSAIKLLANTGG